MATIRCPRSENDRAYRICKVVRMAVTNNNISSQVTVHRRFPNLRMAVTTDDNIFSYLTEAEMTMHVMSIQKGRSTIFRGNPDTLICNM